MLFVDPLESRQGAELCADKLMMGGESGKHIFQNPTLFTVKLMERVKLGSRNYNGYFIWSEAAKLVQQHKSHNGHGKQMRKKGNNHL